MDTKLDSWLVLGYEKLAREYELTTSDYATNWTNRASLTYV